MSTLLHRLIKYHMQCISFQNKQGLGKVKIYRTQRGCFRDLNPDHIAKLKFKTMSPKRSSNLSNSLSFLLGFSPHPPKAFEALECSPQVLGLDLLSSHAPLSNPQFLMYPGMQTK